MVSPPQQHCYASSYLPTGQRATSHVKRRVIFVTAFIPSALWPLDSPTIWRGPLLKKRVRETKAGDMEECFNESKHISGTIAT